MVMELDRKWHLSATPHEIAVTNFEFASMRLTHAFQRWQVAGMHSVVDLDLTAPDLAVLHVVRLQERPKGLSEVARLLSRDDIANVQYSLRKLQGMKLIRSTRNASRKVHFYEVTEEGRNITDAYAALRRRVLIQFSLTLKDAEQELERAALMMEMMAGIYDQAARAATTCVMREVSPTPGPKE